MFLSRNKKNNVYPCKPQFYYVKVGFKEVKIIWVCFRDESWFKNYICLKICLIIKTLNYESQREKAYLRTSALNDNPDLSAHSRSLWSESSLGAFRIVKDEMFLHADIEDSG